MRVMKRWGVMTLVALLVLGSMGAALADDTVEPEEEATVPESGSYQFDWVDNLVSFVFYWGLAEEDPLPECEPVDGDVGTGTFFGPVVSVDEAPCIPLKVEGPNGQVNHGTMVSSFVHWLKNGMNELPDDLQDMPKGQLIKELAHDDFGKGFDGDDGEDEEPELAEEDGDGPPDHVIAKKAEKAKGKKK